jgi:hypothetical protein
MLESGPKSRGVGRGRARWSERERSVGREYLARNRLYVAGSRALSLTFTTLGVKFLGDTHSVK